MEKEKEYVQDYLIGQSIRIGNKRFVLGEREANQDKYLLAEARDTFFGALYENAVVSNDYMELYAELLKRQRAEYDRLMVQRAERGSDGIPYAADACRPDSAEMDYEDQILILKPEFMRPEYRLKEEQLVMGEGGFGCAPKSRGRTVFCRDLWSGKEFSAYRQDILGVMKPELVPEWAAKNAERFRQERSNTGRSKAEKGNFKKSVEVR